MTPLKVMITIDAHHWLRRQVRARGMTREALWCEAIREYCADPKSHLIPMPQLNEGQHTVDLVPVPDPLMLQLQAAALRHDAELANMRFMQPMLVRRAMQRYYTLHVERAAAAPSLAPQLSERAGKNGKKFRL